MIRGGKSPRRPSRSLSVAGNEVPWNSQALQNFNLVVLIETLVEIAFLTSATLKTWKQSDIL